MFKLIIIGCPTGKAWMDKAYLTNLAHQKAICSNAGTCDYNTNKCSCYTGFTGDACEKSNFLLFMYTINNIITL